MMKPAPLPPEAELLTVRDWLRYGTSVFGRAGLVFGHGTACALDEAAFLMLSALHLPINELEPWLDARLTHSERAEIASLFQARIATRKPASYLVNAAYIQGYRFYVDERVIVPRSYIGELLCQGGLNAVLPNPANVNKVLDVCTGSGCLAILAALAFPAAHVDAVELSADALAVATRNVGDYKLNDQITLVISDLLEGLPADAQYDLIIANPPYVASAEVAAFDPEYRAEPVMAHEGGADGLDLVHKILETAAARLTSHGVLVMEIGTGREALELACPLIDFFWLDTATSEGEVFAVTAHQLGAPTIPAHSLPTKKKRAE